VIVNIYFVIKKLLQNKCYNASIMNQEQKNLLIFGFGLALIIPFFVMCHSLKGHLPIWGILTAFVAILVILSKIETLKPVYYGVLLMMYGVIFNQALKIDISVSAKIFLVLALFIWFISIIKVELLKPTYNVWMKGAHFIGTTLSSIVLSVLFYFVFGVVGIVLRILRKDLLEEKLEPHNGSYWHTREPAAFKKEHCLRQF